MMWQVWFIGKRGQGYDIVNAETKEEAKAKANLEKDETVIGVEEYEFAKPSKLFKTIWEVYDTMTGFVYATCDTPREADDLVKEHGLKWKVCIRPKEVVM